MTSHREPAITEVLFALSDLKRLDLLAELLERPRLVPECSSLASMPKSTRSHHFRLLVEAGLITNEPAGRSRLLSLRDGTLASRLGRLVVELHVGSRSTVRLACHDGTVL